MKTIIAGGRDYRLTAADYAKLDEARPWITEVVSGKATGADTCGEQWANRHGIPVQPFPAAWDDLTAPGAFIKYTRGGKPYNANAGFDRNKQMAEYARGGVCILFPGGKGTANMHEEATAAGLQIWDLRK